MNTVSPLEESMNQQNHSPRADYQAAVSRGDLIDDPQQRYVVELLDDLFFELTAKGSGISSFFFKIFFLQKFFYFTR